MTLAEIHNVDEDKKREIDEQRNLELLEILQGLFPNNEVSVLNLDKKEGYYLVNYSFVIDGYLQEDCAYWGWDEDQNSVTYKIEDHIAYIKQLRQKYPEYCKANDYLQEHRVYSKVLKLGNYAHETVYFNVELCEPLKLPNTTRCSVGGGDCEVKRVPKNIERFNNRIDKTIDFLLDCIADLKKMKYQK